MKKNFTEVKEAERQFLSTSYDIFFFLSFCDVAKKKFK
jgi:hypothetical protein